MRAAPRASRIRLLVLDVDGVLTDGGLCYTASGEETKRFHVQDGFALVAALKAGLQIAVLSGRASAAVTRRMAELGVVEVHQGVADKVTALESLREPSVWESIFDSMAGKYLTTAANLVLCRPPSSPPEIRVAASGPISAAELSRLAGGLDTPVIPAACLDIESISSNEFAVFGAAGKCLTAADYLEWSRRFDGVIASIDEALKRPAVWLPGNYTCAFGAPVQNFSAARLCTCTRNSLVRGPRLFCSWTGLARHFTNCAA